MLPAARWAGLAALSCLWLPNVVATGVGVPAGELVVVRADGRADDAVVGAGLQGITQARYGLGLEIVQLDLVEAVLLEETGMRTYIAAVSKAVHWSRFRPDPDVLNRYDCKVVLFDEEKRQQLLSDMVHESKLSQTEYLWQTMVSFCQQFPTSIVVKVQPSQRWIGFGAYLHGDSWFKPPGSWWTMFEPYVNTTSCAIFESRELRHGDRSLLFAGWEEDGQVGGRNLVVNLTSMVNPYHEMFSSPVANVVRVVSSVSFFVVAVKALRCLYWRFKLRQVIPLLCPSVSAFGSPRFRRQS